MRKQKCDFFFFLQKQVPKKATKCRCIYTVYLYIFVERVRHDSNTGTTTAATHGLAIDKHRHPLHKKTQPTVSRPSHPSCRNSSGSGIAAAAAESAPPMPTAPPPPLLPTPDSGPAPNGEASEWSSTFFPFSCFFL